MKNPLPIEQLAADSLSFHIIQEILKQVNEQALKFQRQANSKTAVFYIREIRTIRDVR